MEVTPRIIVPFENTVVTKNINKLSTFYEWKLLSNIFTDFQNYSIMEEVNLNIFFKIGFNTELFKMIVGVLKNCHTQYTCDRSICIFYLIEQHSKFLLHTLQVLYICIICDSTHQHHNRVRSKLYVAGQRWWFQWRFWFVTPVPGFLREEEEHKPDPWRNAIERNHMGLYLEKEVTRRVVYDHHQSHDRSIAAVNVCLKILWRVGGNWAGLHPFAIWNQHCPRSVGIAAIQWAYPGTLYPLQPVPKRKTGRKP